MRRNKDTKPALYEYQTDGPAFASTTAFHFLRLYFPLCGVDARGIKSAITPRLSGDIKIDKERFLTRPASVEDLRQDLRNVFCSVKGRGVVSLVSDPDGEAVLEAGMLWHRLKRVHKSAGIAMEAVNFVPVSDGSVELMRVKVRNIAKQKRVITPTFSMPLFGRALSNKHDHEHVTSLLNRIEQLPNGVCLEPAMVFDERGHRPGESVYYVLGADGQGRYPVGTFPVAERFYGESGSASAPEAVMANLSPVNLSKEELSGQEAMGALRFLEETLAPGECREYVIVMGVSPNREAMTAAFEQFASPEKWEAALKENKAYWQEKSTGITFSTGGKAHDAWMRWVALQPVLRRIFGCSFLPEHDYGKGGKGWRDIWQDLLSLILIEPGTVRSALVDNLAGVRMDGSNATIIGTAPGEFVGDRNAIARVWMDHGLWPLATLLLYIDQTGDYNILLEETTYFRDAQLSRAREKDLSWVPGDAPWLCDKEGKAYKGSAVEHILVQHLTQFFNVGEHNIIRLEDADWNDGLDMARERGESVAFTCVYGGNLLALAGLLEDLAAAKGIKELYLGKEVKSLLDTLSETPLDYGSWEAKRKFLYDTYFPSVQPAVTGEQTAVAVEAIVKDLKCKGEWIFQHIRANEMVRVKEDGETNRWFNGYYDNKGERVEGMFDGNVRMTLTGQVFPIMSGLATEEDIKNVIRSVQNYLEDKTRGGLHLNTNFHLSPYLELGRAFGFAYGAKENGAFFNHMSVMYAYALYKRGFVREGFRTVSAVYAMCADSGTARVYPGIPEYFDLDGRGHYHYLTGSASWLVLMKLTEVFGVRGERGDLKVCPKLVKEEFALKTGAVSVKSRFAGKEITVIYENPKKLDYGDYKIVSVSLNGTSVALEDSKSVRIKRHDIESAPEECVIKVVLG